MPLPLIVEEGVVRVVKELDLERSIVDWYKKWGIDLKLFFGARVWNINSEAPLEYLRWYGRTHVGTSKDENARLQLTLARAVYRKGRWGLSYGAFYSTRIPPQQEAISFVVELNGRREYFQIPYVVKPHAFKASCSQLEAPIQRLDMRTVNQELNYHIDNSIYMDEYLGLYQMNANAAVLSISTFQPQSPREWFNQAINQLIHVQQKNIFTLIIDVSDATGNNTCLAYQLLDYLFPNHDNTLTSDFIHSPNINYSNYHHSNWKRFPSRRSQMGPFTELRGKNKGLYSPLLIDKCPKTGFNPKNLFEFTDLILLSNSACFEACSVFATVLSQVHKILTFTHTAISTSPPAISSMPSTDQATTSQLHYNFPVAITHAFPLREFYSPNTTALHSIMFQQPKDNLPLLSPLGAMYPRPVWSKLLNSIPLTFWDDPITPQK
ncbi:hypothetical protein DSO57_1016610 [Entomophthora muscae]|uniref:Uncharacterized protein n=1 Tax=Entomophthora muscae TaxID=34485 RepID=A0ACC2SI60_9FUNG|nr:hypothetical protein DSO57_1016610 [Entomophthora muscae]